MTIYPITQVEVACYNGALTHPSFSSTRDQLPSVTVNVKVLYKPSNGIVRLGESTDSIVLPGFHHGIIQNLKTHFSGASILLKELS